MSNVKLVSKELNKEITFNHNMKLTYDKYVYDYMGNQYIVLVWHDLKHVNSKICIQRKCSYEDEDMSKYYDAYSAECGFNISKDNHVASFIHTLDVEEVIEALENDYNSIVNNQ